MAIDLNDNIKINAGKPSESKYLNGTSDYTSIAEVNLLVPISLRYLGLTVRIEGVEYWYSDGLSDSDLVEKSSSSSNLNASNGIEILADSGDLGLGGELTKETIINLKDFRFGFQGTENSLDIRQRTTYLTNTTSEYQSYIAIGSELPTGGNGVSFGGSNFDTGANYELSIGGKNPFLDGLTYSSRMDGLGSSTFGLGANCYMGFSDGVGSLGFDLSARSDGFKINDTVFNKGLFASQDFSDNYDDFTYVQKKYVDNAVSQSSVTASNGLTKVGNDVQLGGDVTSKVNINLADPLAQIILGKNGNNIRVTNFGITLANEDSDSSRGMSIDEEKILISSGDVTNSGCRIILNEDGAEDGVNILSINSVDDTLTLFRIANEVSLSYLNSNSGENTSITFGADSEGIEISDEKDQKGLVGAEDYSDNYDQFSYVQKKWVQDNFTDNDSITASNGVQKVGDDIQLGGVIDQEVLVSVQDYLRFSVDNGDSVLSLNFEEFELYLDSSSNTTNAQSAISVNSDSDSDGISLFTLASNGITNSEIRVSKDLYLGRSNGTSISSILVSDTSDGIEIRENVSGRGLNYSNIALDEANATWEDENHIPSIGMIKANLPSLAQLNVPYIKGDFTGTIIPLLTFQNLNNLQVKDEDTNIFLGINVNDSNNIGIKNLNIGQNIYTNSTDGNKNVLLGNDILSGEGDTITNSSTIIGSTIANGTSTSIFNKSFVTGDEAFLNANGLFENSSHIGSLGFKNAEIGTVGATSTDAKIQYTTSLGVGNGGGLKMDDTSRLLLVDLIGNDAFEAPSMTDAVISRSSFIGYGNAAYTKFNSGSMSFNGVIGVANLENATVEDGWSTNAIVGVANLYDSPGAVGNRNAIIGTYNARFSRKLTRTVIVGTFSGDNLIDSEKDIIIGNESANTYTTGSDNIFIKGDSTIPEVSNSIAIGGNVTGANQIVLGDNTSTATIKARTIISDSELGLRTSYNDRTVDEANATWEDENHIPSVGMIKDNLSITPVEITHSSGDLILDLDAGSIFIITVDNNLNNIDFIGGQNGAEYTIICQVNTSTNYVMSFTPGRFKFLSGNIPELTRTANLSLTESTDVYSAILYNDRLLFGEAVDWRNN